MAITSDQVRAWLRLPAGDDVDLIDEVTAATNARVGRMQLAWDADHADPPVDWPADVIHGAVTLAARYYRRRNSPQGLESAADGMVYVPRRDSDVDGLLGLNRPRVG